MIWPPGVAALHRWGLWDRICQLSPARMDTGDVQTPGGRLVGPWHSVEGIDYTVSVRRFRFDSVMLEAAIESGAEVREGTAVQSLITENNRVTGIVAEDLATGTVYREQAHIVVGADGRDSLVARLVGAAKSHEVSTLTANFYAYFSDFESDRDTAQIVATPPREYLIVPTDDGLTVANLIVSRAISNEYRGDITSQFYAAFDMVPELGSRLRNARPVSRFYRATRLPNFFRKPSGPGWALVGDASHCRDPILSQGMHQAFLDAESLADALAAGLSDHEQRRNRRTRFPYQLCLNAARFRFPPMKESQEFIASIQDDPQLIGEYRGLIAGSTDPVEFNRKLRRRESSLPHRARPHVRSAVTMDSSPSVLNLLGTSDAARSDQPA